MLFAADVIGEYARSKLMMINQSINQAMRYSSSSSVSLIAVQKIDTTKMLRIEDPNAIFSGMPYLVIKQKTESESTSPKKATAWFNVSLGANTIE